MNLMFEIIHSVPFEADTMSVVSPCSTTNQHNYTINGTEASGISGDIWKTGVYVHMSW